MKHSILLLAFLSFFNLLNKESYPQTPNWLWAKDAGGMSSDYPQSITVDASGNTYLAGSFLSHTITFGSSILTNVGNFDIFLVKYDANGNVLWAKSVGGTKDDYANSVALDSAGNPYVAGIFASPNITFDTIVLTNAGNGDMSDIFITKYDANGNVLWAKSAGGTVNDAAYSVAVDISGNAYVAGGFFGSSITFGSTTLPNAGESDTFLTKYNTNGTVLWAVGAGGTSADEARSVGIDTSGNIYLTGVFNSPSLIFGYDTLTNMGAFDIFVVKYNDSGNVLWANRIGGIFNDFDPFLAVQPDGNIYVTGAFVSDTLTVSNFSLTNMGAVDIFLTKYDANGSVLWATSAGGWGSENPKSIEVDASGNAYIVGEFYYSTLSFGNFTLRNTSLLSCDVFLAKYDANGNVLLATSFGGTDIDYISCITLDVSGNSYLAGSFQGPTITFGSVVLTNVSYSFDLYLAKLGSNLGINERTDLSDIPVVPNPAKDKVTIIRPAISEKCHLSILSVSGNQLLQQEIREPNTLIDISTLPRGVYFVRLTGEKTIQVGKFVKQ